MEDSNIQNDVNVTSKDSKKMKYDFKEVLGSGTSSTVFRAIHRITGKEFAVKMVEITSEHGDAIAEQVKKETLREINILNLCKGHDNIIQLYENFQSSTAIFLVMELCKKGELFDYLNDMISLTEKRVRILMKQIIEAVDFIHERNIVHRDLKPENILMDDNFNVKISDFGFGVILEEGEKLTDLCGTPSYLAPEVLAKSMYENAPGYGKEVDMWACGVIMYTLLCGQPPFWNRRQMVMLRAIMNGDFGFNNPEWDTVSQNAKNIVRQLLIVDPKQRMTAEDALAHPFFHSDNDRLARRFFIGVQDAASKIEPDMAKINKFRVGVYCILFIIRTYRPAPMIVLRELQDDPYNQKTVRRCIDTAAFCMYRHWVKKEIQQSRAALFENSLRMPCLKHLMSLSSLSSDP